MTAYKPQPPWLEWARELQALGQTGLNFSLSDYDTERYQRLLHIAAEIIAHHSTLSEPDALHSFQSQHGYATPKIDVRSAVIHDNQILLVRERSDGRWSLPGGWADVGDRPSQVAVRETKEESGYDVAVDRLVGVYDANRAGRPMELYHAFKLVFLCHLTGGHAKPSVETSEVTFFDWSNLPPLSSNRTNEHHLADIQTAFNHPDTPAVFD
jgi:ADP-ribose pyrophosphatase YjhB (NUDIX family)